MAESLREHRCTWSSINDHVDLRRSPMEILGGPTSTNPPATTLDNISEKNLLIPASKSRRTLRQLKSMVGEPKAYPLPDPSQFQNPSNAAPLPLDPIDDILYPMQSLKKERERSQEPVVCTPAEQPSVPAVESPSRPPSCMGDTDKQPFPGDGKVGVETAKRLKSSGDDSEIEVLTTLEEEEDHVDAEQEKEVQATDTMAKVSSKVVLVYDGEKKFSTAPVDIALNGYATAEGDAIIVVVFLEHIMSPSEFLALAFLSFVFVDACVMWPWEEKCISGEQVLWKQRHDESKRIQIPTETAFLFSLF